MKLTTNFVNCFPTKIASQMLMLSSLILVACLSGCATSGSLQPHQAFRQAATPYQAAYYQGPQTGFGQNGFGGAFNPATAGNPASFPGYNNAPANFGQANPNLTGGSGFRPQSFMPTTGYNYQPAFSGGFSSGSC